MNQEEFKDKQKKTLRYTLLSIIHHTNSMTGFSDENKEILLNNVFNIILNSLKPDAAIIWNDEIFRISMPKHTTQNVKEIMDILKKDFDDKA